MSNKNILYEIKTMRYLLDKGFRQSQKDGLFTHEKCKDGIFVKEDYYIYEGQECNIATLPIVLDYLGICKYNGGE